MDDRPEGRIEERAPHLHGCIVASRNDGRSRMIGYNQRNNVSLCKHRLTPSVS